MYIIFPSKWLLHIFSWLKHVGKLKCKHASFRFTHSLPNFPRVIFSFFFLFRNCLWRVIRLWCWSRQSVDGRKRNRTKRMPKAFSKFNSLALFSFSVRLSFFCAVSAGAGKLYGHFAWRHRSAF